MRAAAKLAGIALVAVMVALVASAAMLVALLRPAPGEWAEAVRLGPWRLRVSMPTVLRMATHPLGLRLLAGRSLQTTHGHFSARAGADENTLVIVCDPCTPHHPRLGPTPLHLPPTELRLVRVSQTLLRGQLVSGAVVATWEARLDARGGDLALHLPDTPLADLYALFGEAIPELARARIEGRAGADLQLAWPAGGWRIEPRIEAFSVDGLGTEALIGASATPGCGATEPLRFGTWLPRAVIAAEDQRFFEHAGLDLVEMRAAWRSEAGAAPPVRGASTLSQQLAKLLFTGSDRSAVRKLREALYAVELDRVLGKARVLQLYLAIAPWGEGRCGAQAAALQLLGKPAAALTPIEAAWLASLLRNPDAVLAEAATRGGVDRRRVAAVLDAMRPMPKAQRAAWGERLAGWAPQPVEASHRTASPTRSMPPRSTRAVTPPWPRIAL